ncbi:MAG: hypothetical protein AB7G75_30530 [Candidatus Binatia bacterium]
METRQLRLGDVIQAVSACSTSEQEVLATLSYLVNSGRIQVGGTSAKARLSLLPRSRKVTGLVLHK